MATKRVRTGNDLDATLRRIRDAREAHGLSQETLGKKLGMSRAGYGHLESGANMLALADLLKIARILDRPVEYFLGLATELTEDEGQLLTLYRKAPTAENRLMILRLLRTMIEGF